MSGFRQIPDAIIDQLIDAGRLDEIGALVWLARQATIKPRDFRIGRQSVRIEKGEYVVSYRQLAETWGWSRMKVSRFLEMLEGMDIISRRTGTATARSRTIITLCFLKSKIITPSSVGTKTGQERDTNIESYRDIDIPSNDGQGDASPRQAVKDDPPTDLFGEQAPAPKAPAPTPNPKAAPNPAALIFASGVQLLTASGKSDKVARAFLGKLRKTHGDAPLIAAIGQAQREGAVDPMAYLQACLRYQSKKTANAGVSTDLMGRSLQEWQ